MLCKSPLTAATQLYTHTYSGLYMYSFPCFHCGLSQETGYSSFCYTGLCVCVCVCVLSRDRLFACNPMDCRLLCSWDSPRKNTGVGGHFLLLPFLFIPNPGIEPLSAVSSALAGRFFTTSATWFLCLPFEIRFFFFLSYFYLFGCIGS